MRDATNLEQTFRGYTGYLWQIEPESKEARISQRGEYDSNGLQTVEELTYGFFGDDVPATRDGVPLGYIGDGSDPLSPWLVITEDSTPPSLPDDWTAKLVGADYERGDTIGTFESNDFLVVSSGRDHEVSVIEL